MAKMKSRPKILICRDVLGDDLTTPEKKELFQSEPYSSRNGRRFIAKPENRGQPVAISR
jgi:hypothetical protein